MNYSARAYDSILNRAYHTTRLVLLRVGLIATTPFYPILFLHPTNPRCFRLVISPERMLLYLRTLLFVVSGFFGVEWMR